MSKLAHKKPVSTMKRMKDMKNSSFYQKLNSVLS